MRFTYEQKKLAVETFIASGCKTAKTIRQLGYPGRTALANWYKDYLKHHEVRPAADETPFEERKRAVDFYLSHDKDARLTLDTLGYPKTFPTLYKWIDELAPGQREIRTRNTYSYEKKARICIAIRDQHLKLVEASRIFGPSRHTLAAWLKELSPATISPIEEVIDMDKQMCNDIQTEELQIKRAEELLQPESQLDDSLSLEELQQELKRSQEQLKSVRSELKSAKRSLKKVRATLSEQKTETAKLKATIQAQQEQKRDLQMEIDIRNMVAETLKKDLGTDPNRLSNLEKARVIEKLRKSYPLNKLLTYLKMAKSSYEYARKNIDSEEPETIRRIRQRIIEIFEENFRCYGYRKIQATLNDELDFHIGEHVVRRIMREENLVCTYAKRKARFNSYKGEISEAPENIPLGKDGKHNFFASEIHTMFVTDITEFALSDGKVYLSPLIDCFDGYPFAWTISTSPNEKQTNDMLLQLKDVSSKEHPVIVHTDRGSHYRWPKWIKICEDLHIIRSMSRKGHSGDNARCEGFFGHLKTELWHDRDWKDETTEGFIKKLDEYMRWYRDKRLKSDLDYKSPRDYRLALGYEI